MMINNFYMINPNMNSIYNQNSFCITQQQKTLLRLKKEFQLCLLDDDLKQIGCTFGLYPGNNLFKWRVTMFGPQDSPYKDGIFTIKIIFPDDYPKHGPEFRFMNKIYHLNVDLTGELGHICLYHLNEWGVTGRDSDKKVYGVKQALFDIFCLLCKQNVDCPLSDEMAQQYKNDRKKFDEIARKWTKEYAQLTYEKE